MYLRHWCRKVVDIVNIKGAKTRAFILREACQIFEERGFKSVTMKDICDATNLSRGGLYCHYESTEQIFLEILSNFMSTQENEIEMKIQAKEPAVEILNQILERYRCEMLDAKKTLSLAIYEYFSMKRINNDDDFLTQQYVASFHTWNSLLRYGISCGVFKEMDTRSVFDLIIFSYQGIRMYSRLMTIDQDVPERIIDQIKALILIERGV